MEEWAESDEEIKYPRVRRRDGWCASWYQQRPEYKTEETHSDSLHVLGHGGGAGGREAAC